MLAPGDVEVKHEDLAPALEIIRSETRDGFKAFYALMRNRAMPRHAEGWVDKLFDEYERQKALVDAGKKRAVLVRYANEAFAGSTKTTTFTETFVAWQIGLHPERSNLIIQASDLSARQHASNIADMIAVNPLWKLVFPHVVPDQAKGWGANGYWVIDTRYEAEWTRLRHKDPSLLGDSYGAAIVVGKHPTGVCVIDDVNDDKNTESPARSEEVNRILSDTIIPRLEDTPWAIFNQTPWNKRDALAMVKATGVWTHTVTPILAPDDNGEPVEVKTEDGQVVYSVMARLAWPEKFDAEQVAFLYRQTGFLGFARMYLCNIEAQEGLHLKADWLRRYPRESLDPSWQVVFGIDYASTLDKIKGADRDFFSLAVGVIIPTGGLVVVNGKNAHVSQGEALRLVESWAAEYHPSMICVETYGSGDEFYQLLLTGTDLPLWPDKGPKSKSWRYEKVLGPAFELGRVWLASGVSNDFINTFEQQWKEWPACEHDDALDSVYELTVAASKLGGMGSPEAVTSPQSRLDRLRADAQYVNPWATRRRP